MSTHRDTTNPPPRTPNWLKALYAVLVFMAFVVLVSTLLK